MSIPNSILIPGLVASAFTILLSGCSFPNKTATTTAAMVSGTFSSGETLEVLRALNNGEIAQAELAKDKTDNDDVESVAEAIIDDHKAVNERVGELVDKGIEPEKSPLSRGLAKQAQEIQEDLAPLAGAEFDCAYLNKQVAQHQLALETLRSQVQPDANDPKIEDLLEDVIATLEQHREDAAQARKDVRGCA